ncbi:MAG: thiaminase II [Clostridiales bacterium]|nr:thiaminase II [Clostridiales bacterium]
MLFTDYLFENVKYIWDDYLNHPFLKEMGQGTLDREKFKSYLIQDYLYLKEYAKVYSMALIKSENIKQMKFCQESINGILEDESANHIWYLKNFGENIEELEKYKIKEANENYTSYMKSISLSGNLKEIMVSARPCAWSYYYIGKKLKEIYKDNMEGNFFESWIECYSSEEYAFVANKNIDFVNELCKNIDEIEKEKLKEIFIKASIYEMKFWDMAYEEVI